jgi:hypothetical protein
MMSAPNRQLRLSGNSRWLIGLSLATLFACAGPKKAVHKPVSNEHPTPPKEEQVKVYDPASGTYVLVPRSTIKVDTIRWSVDTKSPLITDRTTAPESSIHQTRFQISLLMPFSINPGEDDQFDGSQNRFLQYYGGVQLAMQSIDTTGFSISLHTYDVDGTMNRTKSVLKDSNLQRSDVIIGPYDKEELDTVAVFGLKHETMVVSPWLPAFNIPSENPFFIQANPGLAAHASAITSFIQSQWPDKKVFLVARDIPAEINRLSLFKQNNQLQAEDLIIKDDTPELANTDLQQLLAEEGTIFVMPYYSRADEGFVNSFLRKLHADKELKEVIVFGLPQWLGFSNLNPNYMESLSVHISVSTYIDPTHPDYTVFKQKYFEKFHTIPDLQAFLGYDLITWIAHGLMASGKYGLIGTSSVWLNGIATSFDIRPVYKGTNGSFQQEMQSPLYYENTRIRILKYEGQDFHLVN